VSSNENVTEETMPPEKIMSINERRTYLGIMALRYACADKGEQTQLLDEMERVTRMHRKAIIRLLHGDLSRHPRQKQRGSIYGPALDDALRLIAESYDYPCAERLTPNLVTMAQQLARHGEITVTPALLEQLGQISTSTVGRTLHRLHQDEPALRRPTAGNSALTRDIPMTIIPWNEQDPGHFETDLVHHCGSLLTGQYTHTLQLADVATGWSERVAMFGRSYTRMEEAFRCVQTRLPFAILELHPDNGGEFFNRYMLAFWHSEVAAAALSRSRPYHKNDNRFVEQRNQSHVRAYLGDRRFDTLTQTLAINRLYEKLWVYDNLFQPTMRLSAKETVTDEKGTRRTRRTYDQARPPFDRLCATVAITPQRRDDLARLRDQTNPRRLREEIYTLIERIMDMPGAAAVAAESD
jgi:hypothetical protein